METKNDFEFVQQVVEMIMGHGIFDKNRRRRVVETRMMFGLLMVELNYPLTQIGEFMKKDHTTIIHYKRTMRGFLDTDNEMLRRYLKCKELIISEKQPVNLLTDEDFKVRSIRLQNQVDVMRIEQQLLRDEISMLESKIELMEDKRFMKIFKLIKDNTPVGHELIVERKIRKMFDD
jgi:hypothetical protein